ncbi:MAG: hypothetical protein K0B01_07695 [Syntrophobacterales bacterium]|nr:hypothetical protein [Syntrophobacterales bacterium]
MKLQDQKREGLYPEHADVQSAMQSCVRLTIPAREALETCGAVITPEPMDADIGMPTYSVQLAKTIPGGAAIPGGM